MSYDSNEDYNTGFREEENNNNNTNNNTNKPRDSSNVSDNIVFKNDDDDLMVKEGESSEEQRVSYFGIFSDTTFSSIINITSSAIGVGCLHFPSILSTIGLPLTIIIFLFVSLCIYYTIDLLRYFVVDTKFFSFALMTNEILGKNWLRVYTISSLIFYISVEINYLSTIYNTMSKMIDLNGNYKLLLNIIYFLISISIEIFISSYIAKIKRIHLFSLIASLLFIIILLIIIIQGIKNMIDGPGNKFDKDVLISPIIHNKSEFFFGLMSFIIEFVYGYSYHSSYPTLLKNLRSVDDGTTKKVHNISFCIIFMSYFLITFFGFFLKYSIADIIEKNLDYSFAILFFRIILCLFLFSVVPLRFIVIRDNYSSLIDNNKISFRRDLIYVCEIILFCNLIVYLTNKSIIDFNIVTNFMQLFGGIFGVIISFVLPVVNFVGANGRRKVKSIIGYIFAGVFCVIGLLSVGYSIYGLAIKNKFDN